MYHYYIEPTVEQKRAYEQMKSSSGISFPFRVYSQKSETMNNEIYETSLNLPSTVACMAFVCFINKGNAAAQTVNSKELDFAGAAGWYKCSGKI